MTGRRGRRRRKLLDDLKERRGYSHLKEEALDRTMWRNRFRGGFGPVVRQTNKWTNVRWPQLLKRCSRIALWFLIVTGTLMHTLLLHWLTLLPWGERFVVWVVTDKYCDNGREVAHCYFHYWDWIHLCYMRVLPTMRFENVLRQWRDFDTQR